MTALASRSPRSYPNNSALGRGIRVKLSAGYLLAAGAGDDELGVMEDIALAGDTMGTVRALGPDTVYMVASEALTAPCTLYRAASGKVSDTPNGSPIATALESATGDNSIIECLPLRGAAAQAGLVEAHTADDTLVAAEMYGSIHTSVGAAGTVVLSLPAAVVGMNAKFAVGAAQELRLDPNGTETISLPSTGVPGAAGKYLTANAIGETVELVCCSAGSWRVFGFTGTWTAEA